VIHGILRDEGHNVYLQRRKVDDLTQAPHPHAIYESKLERHTTRHMHPSSTGLATMGTDKVEGRVTTVDAVYWFLWTVNPKQGDRIYENDPRYTSRQSVWEIDYAQPMRGTRGRVEFWAVGATRTSPE
jgi:hypothetical protein